MQTAFPRPPIEVLANNLVHNIESLAGKNKHPLQVSVDAGHISSQIDYELDAVPPRAPFADHIRRAVCFQESYLAYLWAYIYSNFVVFEEAVQRRLLNGTFSGAIEFDTPLLRRAKSLGDWAEKFALKYEKWDEALLPNPRYVLDSAEKEFVGKVNGIFLGATSYLFFHEYAHLILGHDPTADDALQIEQEKEADNFALSFLVSGSTTDVERQIAGLSIVLLCSSNFHLASSVHSVWQDRHPDMHERLRFGLSGLNLGTPASKYYLYFLASINIKRFLEAHGIATKVMTEDTAEELFFEYLEQFDRLRLNWNI